MAKSATASESADILPGHVPEAMFNAFVARAATLIGQLHARVTSLESMIRLRDAQTPQYYDQLFGRGGVSANSAHTITKLVREELLATVSPSKDSDAAA